MRVLKSNGIEIGIRANNMSRMFYFQEFDKELDFTLDEIKQEQYSESEITVELFKIIWCMAKAENYFLRKSTPCYSQWVQFYKNFDINHCITIVFEEIRQGFIITRTYSSESSSKSSQKEDYSFNLGQKIFVIGKKIGLSMDDINEFTTQQLIDIFHFYSNENKKDYEDNIVKATPKQAEDYFR